MSAVERFASHARVLTVSALLLTSLDVAVLYLHRANAVLLPREWILVVLGAAASNTLAASILVGIVTLFLWRFGFRDDVESDERVLSIRRARLFTSTLALFAAAALGWTLTTGRQASQIPMRPLAVLAFALVVGAFVWGALSLHTALRERWGRGGRVALVVLSVLVCASSQELNASLFPRTYPAFHLAMSLLTLIVALVAADALFVGRPVRFAQTWSVFMLAVATACAFCFAKIVRLPEIHFALEENAPVAGQVARRWPVRYPDRPAPRNWQPVSEVVADVSHEGSVDLRGRSVLLITVDALRADALRASGGSGLMPNLDELASQGVAFTRAYTSTPHTSYAVTGILTGAFVRFGMESDGEEARTHETLAELLASRGMRTAAFYPPAVFYVDQHQFEAYRATHFGFATFDESFASGVERVRQLRAYLESASDRGPTFVWVHLFEPHEPYEPPPEFARGDSDRERYDGELRAADAAIGQLVRVFRGAYPDAIAIVTSDHGEEFGEHGGQFHGTTLYDEQVRVPLVWSAPGVQPRTVQSPVQNVDIAPTLLATLGVPPPMRMHGADLSTLLAGSPETDSRVAFASLEMARAAMLTDGRWKVICRPREALCSLFDLHREPGESLDERELHRDVADALAGRLYSFIEAVPARDAETTDAASLALAQAELGNRRIAPQLMPLLSSDEPAVRAKAARFLGEFGYEPATPVLASLRASDGEASVRDEAALATLLLGDTGADAPVVSLVQQASTVSGHADAGVPEEAAAGVARRAAVALALRENPAGGPILLRIVGDTRESAESRSSAMMLSASLRVRGARELLERLLPDPTLGVHAARSLGVLGDRRALPALRAALAVERYPASREAETEAIRRLGGRVR